MTAPDDAQPEQTPNQRPEGTFAPLRVRAFRNVWLASFVSSIGGWMEMVGVQWEMASRTKEPAWLAAHNPAPAVMMSYLALAHMLPLLFFCIIGGVLADRVDRKRLLLLTQACRMVIAAGLCVLAFAHHLNPWLLLALAACDGVAMAFNIPAWQVLTPRLVPRSLLAHAITLNGLQFNLARAVGPAVGGVLLALGEVWILFAINTLSFLGVLIAIAGTPAAPPDPASRTQHPWAALREATTFVVRHKGARHVLVMVTLFSFCATPVLRFMPLVVAGTYAPGAGDAWHETLYGLLLAAMGIGAAAGVFVLARVPAWYPRHHLIPLSLLACGIALAVHASSTSFMLAAVSILVVGVFWFSGFNAAFSALQLLVPDAQRGRVLAIVNTIGFGAMPLGAVVVAWISEGVASSAHSADGVRFGIGTLAVALTMLGAAWLSYRVPEVDGEHAEQPSVPGLWRGITGLAHRR